MSKSYSATGVVYGNCWGGGKCRYAATELSGFSSLRALKTEAKEMLKTGALDSGMGYESLIGALLYIRKETTITFKKKVFYNVEIFPWFVGKLSVEEGDFLAGLIY